MRNCVKCGAALEPASGPGRPASYCSATCKRLVEYELRRLDKRIADYQLELRGLKFDGPDAFNDDDRQKRMRALRRWIAVDEERLAALLGQNNQESAETIKPKPHAPRPRYALHSAQVTPG